MIGVQNMIIDNGLLNMISDQDHVKEIDHDQSAQIDNNGHNSQVSQT